jgi:ABC-type dipeptide/oligopeptide/nickel transport system permease subunit
MASSILGSASADVPAARAGVARRLARQRGAMVGAAILAVLALMAVGAPRLATRDPIRTAPREASQPPGARYLLGTDQFGRDVASRVLHGARLSLTVGLIAVGIAVGLGVPIGLVSGFYGGRLDVFAMRVMDVLLAFPGILLALAIVGVLSPGLGNVMIAVGLAAGPDLCAADPGQRALGPRAALRGGRPRDGRAAIASSSRATSCPTWSRRSS